jgi:hypothetical protein
MPTAIDRHFLKSTYREKVLEHVFVGELLKYLWVAGLVSVDLLKPEVDSAGYDVVITAGRIVRHVQLKASLAEGKAGGQKINASLAEQPSGCVVWVLVDDTLSIHGFLWFGGMPGSPLPDISGFKQARHTRANALGFKPERANTKVIPKSKFEAVSGMPALVEKLFGEVERHE